METSLHRQLKESCGGPSEVTVAGFRVDAIDQDGCLVEVQSGPLGPLRTKLTRLLPEHRLRVLKPVVVQRRVVRRRHRDGRDLSARQSPWRGALVDVFDDLVGGMRTFPHPNLWIDVLSVQIDEVRIPRRRWPGYRVVDRVLRSVKDRVTLHQAEDLWALLPPGITDPFTTRDLAVQLDRPLFFAQRVAYCLRLAGAVETLGKTRNSCIYRRCPADGRMASPAIARIA